MNEILNTLLCMYLLLYMGIIFLFIIFWEEYNESPLYLYVNWLENKNIFGKIYTAIGILITLPSALATLCLHVIGCICKFILKLGEKK